MVEEPEDYRDLLDDAIGSSPPSNVDLDAVIAGERRRTRMRRTGAGASAVAVVATIGLIVAALLPGGEAPQAAHQGPAPTSTASTPRSGPSPTATLGQNQADRLWPELKHSIVKIVPDAKPVPPKPCQPGGSAETPLTFCGHDGRSDEITTLTAGVGARAPYYFLTADVPAADGTRGLFIIIQRAGPQRDCPALSPPSHCSTSIGPDGDRVLSITGIQTPGMPAHALMNMVSVRHPDGTEVIATAQNWAASATSTDTVMVKSPAAAVQQLREIAITPQISLTH